MGRGCRPGFSACAAGALGEQAGAAAGADRARQVALLGGGEHGGGDIEGGQRGHAGSCVLLCALASLRGAYQVGPGAGVDKGAGHDPVRSPSRSGRREEIEAGRGGGAGEGEAEEGVAQGDGEAGEDAHVDLGLAGAEEAAELAGTVAYRADA